MANILVIDDQKDVLEMIRETLVRQGHQVTIKTKTKDIKIKELNHFELILLDVMMPEQDGFSYCKEIRKAVDAPILFLTAKSELKDIVEGLSIGADDYIVKPFRLEELSARVHAHLRRECRPRRKGLKWHDIFLDFTSKEIFVGNEKISVTKSEYEICEFLSKNSGRVFSRTQIYLQVFGYEGESNENVISVHIKNIRAKFHQKGASPIETVWGIGYKWKNEDPLV